MSGSGGSSVKPAVAIRQGARFLPYGLVSGFEIEYGYISLSELESVRGPLGLPVERDLYYTSQTLKDIEAYERKLRN